MLEHLEAGHVGQAEVEHRAVERGAAEGGERLATGRRGRDLDVVVTEQLGDAHLLGGVVLDDEELPVARRGVLLDPAERRLEALRGGGLRPGS